MTAAGLFYFEAEVITLIACTCNADAVCCVCERVHGGAGNEGAKFASCRAVVQTSFAFAPAVLRVAVG